ncbi:MAG TPA: DNA polymerase III subunit delta' [Caulobacteraceae bacterium]|nr:DNA polymerase III subunit delta' [Caulobacteraceae bacterium]
MPEASATAHPRDVYAYERGEAAETALLAALGRNRLHHGWLLTGPEGLGKATFAYRAARRLLGAAPDPAHGLLGAAPSDPVSQLVAARSHPDLLVVERWTDDGKARRVIPVEEARRLPEFFSKAPGLARWRIAIVDSVDDLNPSGANALLKILEEPPERGVLFLVSHAPGALLDTIRSRCRRLSFRPWPDEAVADFLRRRSELSDEDALRLAKMAHGAPGRALRQHEKGGLAADDAARRIMAALPSADSASMQAVIDGFRSGEGAERFAMLIERLGDHAAARATAAAAEGARESRRWAELALALADLPGEVEGLNLDRGDAFWTTLGELRRAARS